MSDLVEFLIARIDEDEAVARDVTAPETGGHWHAIDYEYQGIGVLDGPDDGGVRGGQRTATTAQITRWDPARVLAECESKRRIVEAAVASDHGFERPEPWGFGVLRLLALPYADHDDYDPAWNPEATQ